MIILKWLKVSRRRSICAFKIAGAVFAILLSTGKLWAKEPLHVAVATNFLGCAKQLKASFQTKFESDVILSAASSGKLFAQIVHGAPYDVFLSADALRPQQLIRRGLVNQKHIHDYAIGEIVVWHPGVSPENFSVQSLLQPSVTRLAIANPKTAPYGLAAKQFLTSKQLMADVKDKIVRGENVAQAGQFVRSGNAQVGIVAKSMLIPLNDGNYTVIEQAFYEPITQQLARISDRQEAKHFVEFMTSVLGKSLIKQCGYKIP